MSMNAGQHGKDTTGESSLAAYLHSHLIAAAAGERLFGQAAKTWKDSPRGETIGRLAMEVSADKAALEGITEGIDLGMPAYKKPFAWIGAHLASLGPLNPLHSRTGAAEQLEIEALISAVTGKSLLWKTLNVLSRTDPRIGQERVANLLDRATAQLRELEGLLLETAAERFTATGQ
ncbi:hypothetical protein [Arthrobacter sp. ok362]|uniref:hypothetical protein n=1 Tax=Arthrobacter sp. ok362 TaxID=1761745 RepID=UPI00088AEC3F|nr:hypothetical protein [Arthrobacter sp. ok362]SDK92270.1 hypothetical protein SAMN04487913_104115 [Arthrobacter sp. ok362]